MSFPLVVLSIFGVNLALSGDNAVLIASVMTGAPRDGRGRAVAISATLAAIVLVVATVFASRWLRFPILQLGGGVFVMWVAFNLFRGPSGAESQDLADSRTRRRGPAHRRGRSPRAERRPHSGVGALIGSIVAAEVAMSVDNVFAVAAIAKGDAGAVALGLGPSVVVVVCASRFLAGILERYPVLTLAVGGLLGGVAAEMITTDPLVENVWNTEPWVREGVPIAAALGMVLFGGFVRLRERGGSRAP